jgi:hypothetical protein
MGGRRPGGRRNFYLEVKEGNEMHERGEIGEKLSPGGGTAPSINDNSLF